MEQKQNGKKKKITKIAALCLALLMLSTAVVGITFSKYLREQNQGGTGNVAEFGVTMPAWTGNLFAHAYTTDDEGYGEENSVVMAGENTVLGLAPGTDGSAATSVKVENNEVAISIKLVYTITYTGWTVTYDDDSNGETEEVVYKPVVVSIKIGDQAQEIVADGTEQTIDIATVKAGEGYAKKDLSIEWAWAFNGNDLKDTEVADLDANPSITIAAKLVATQID